MAAQGGAGWMHAGIRLALLVLLAGLSLQVFFALRIATMAWLDPRSTTFQRSQAWQLALAGRSDRWQQPWRDLGRISSDLQRAVIASEDAGFPDHDGVDWAAIERAWERNQQARAQARESERPATAVRVIGGSTISQQLAKNLFLSGERTFLRKGQELVLTLMLERLLDKRRILEIYLNSVEWGEGAFGAQAAAQRHHGADADRLSAAQAARLAVMLPRPRDFETRPGSAYLVSRAATIRARMRHVQLP